MARSGEKATIVTSPQAASRVRFGVEKEWNHAAHTGETPPQIAQEALEYSRKAVAQIESARPGVTRNLAEFDRLCNESRRRPGQ